MERSSHAANTASTRSRIALARSLPEIAWYAARSASAMAGRASWIASLNAIEVGTGPLQLCSTSARQ